MKALFRLVRPGSREYSGTMDSHTIPIRCDLELLDPKEPRLREAAPGDRWMEFHVHAKIRSIASLDSAL